MVHLTKGRDVARWQRLRPVHVATSRVTSYLKKKTPPIHCGRQTGFRSGRHLYTAYISYFTHTHTPYAHSCLSYVHAHTRDNKT